jgi:outer membrane scaffolding protein for murein synthesis (MipA/OmpV family)
MNKFAPIALVATLTLFSLAPAALHAETSQSVRASTEAAASVNAIAGQTLYGANGNRVAAIYRVAADGRVQVILDGRLITVPGSTLSEVNGKVTTSLTKSDLLRTAR